jgi:16S rRNA (guanine966-N2)-methyltransferase
MRISSGIAKNKRIKSQNSRNVRPTMSRVKEAVFDIIKPYLEDAMFLDLFSGTGNMALEALSRGVKRAVMIEKNKDAVSIIIENVNSMGFEDRCRAYKNEVNRAIEILSRKREVFDIIFIDPPYKEELCTDTITRIDTFKLLSERGIVLAEHHEKEKLADEIGNLKKVDERNYSGKVITFYTY